MIEHGATAAGVKKLILGAFGGGVLGAWVASLFVSKKTVIKKITSIVAGAISAQAITNIFMVIYPQYIGLEVSIGFVFGLLAMAVFAVIFEMLSNPREFIKLFLRKK